MAPRIRRARLLSIALLLAACGEPAAGADAGRDAGAVPCARDQECDDGLYCDGTERCDPTTARCSPGAPPCGGACDEIGDTCASCTTDADGDGHLATACGGDDCNDADPGAFPGNPETCDAAGHDDDCDPSTFGDRDVDRDRFVDARCCNVGTDGTMQCGEDCDDARRGTNPVVPEVCDRLDNDCDGTVDEEVSIGSFRDVDRDLHGDPLAPAMACAGVAGYSNIDDDCDDTNRFVHGAQVEITDGVDNDCDRIVDESAPPATWYYDSDRDGFGTALGGMVSSVAPILGYSLLSSDCDDLDPTRSPIATELCNARDDDCDGQADFAIGVNDWEDDDADGEADGSCPGGAGTDCDDGDPLVHTGASERCNRADDDCDGRVDETCAVPMDAGIDASTSRDAGADATSPDAGRADLIVDGTTIALGGTHRYGLVRVVHAGRITVPPFTSADPAGSGNLILIADSIWIDATSSIDARGAGYSTARCANGAGPTATAGGVGGCAVRDGGGGGAHMGAGGRGTHPCVATCSFPMDFEEDCVSSLNAGGTLCTSTASCTDGDGLPSVGGQPWVGSIYTPEPGASGGDKGCRDGDGFGASPAVGGAGGGHVVLVALTPAATGAIQIDGTITAHGRRGCATGTDAGGGGAGGTVGLVGDVVQVSATAHLDATGGLGGDELAAAPGQPDASDCPAGAQTSGTCRQCGGGGGGGLVEIVARTAQVEPSATIDAGGGQGGTCPVCAAMAAGASGTVRLDTLYVGEVCDGLDDDFDGLVDEAPAAPCP